MSFLGIADIIGTAMTNNENHNQAIYNRKFQKEENEKVRAHNLELAKMQNSWNIQQWNRENAYNHPSAQKARLEAAGLNADLMYGGTGVSNTSASSPQMTSGAPASYQDWSGFYAPYQAPSFSNMLDNQLKQAQIDNINADTEKKGHEASILASDAAYRDAYNKGLIETQNVTIEVGHTTADKNRSDVVLNNQKIKESQAYIANLQASTASIQTGIEKIRNDIAVDNARLDIDKALSKEQLTLIKSQYGLNDAQANRLKSELEKVLRNLDDEHDINVAEVARLGSDKALLDSNKNKSDAEYALLQIKKDIVQFKSNVLTARKRDLTGMEAICRATNAMIEACLQGM